MSSAYLTLRITFPPILKCPNPSRASLVSTRYISRTYSSYISSPLGPVVLWHPGHAVAQLVEALRCKPEARGFDSWWCHWNFSLTKSFRSHYGPGVDSACNRNEYQEYLLGVKGGRCVGLTTLLPSYADCLDIWKLQPPGALRVCPGL
jgi:hypothetical protein